MTYLYVSLCALHMEDGLLSAARLHEARLVDLRDCIGTDGLEHAGHGAYLALWFECHGISCGRETLHAADNICTCSSLSCVWSWVWSGMLFFIAAREMLPM